MKGDTINIFQTPKHQSQDHCPPKKSPHINTEISLETLEILLTSVPDEEITLTSDVSSGTKKEESLRKSIDQVIAHKQHYIKRLQHLLKRKRGAEWLYRNLSYFQTQFPWELISLLENMAHQNTPDITHKLPKSIYDLNSLHHSTGHSSEDVMEKLEGLRILTTNIRRLIFNNLETPLQQLTPELIDKCSAEELTSWNNWCANIESHLRHIDELLSDGENFFSLRNFKLMEQLPLSERSLSALKAIINKVTTA